jgi:PIN domain
VKVLLDADVVLDVALDRFPFAEESSAVLDWCQNRPASAWLAWHTISVVYYLIRPARGDSKARAFIADLLRGCEVAAGGKEAVRRALALPLKDFEDSLQVAAGIAADVQFIVTRNKHDYRASPVPAIGPREFVQRFIST